MKSRKDYPWLKDGEELRPPTREESDRLLIKDLRAQLSSCQKELASANECIRCAIIITPEEEQERQMVNKELVEAKAEAERLKDMMIQITNHLDPSCVYKMQLDKAIIDGFNKFAEMVKEGKI